MAQAPRCILITGASAGLGAALARAYAGPDMTLGLIARNNERLLAVAESCRQRGAQVVTASLDVTDTEALQTWIKNFDHAHPIDLLIANAGITSQLGPQGQAEPLECIHRVLDTNLRGCIDSVDAVLHAMRQRGHGQIALVSSLAALHGMPVTPAYCAAKAGVKAYGEALRGWLAPEGIHVNVICPGFVESEMSRQFSAPKPFMISAEHAARRIQRGLSRNRACISFPFPLNLGMWLLSVLPFPLASFFSASRAIIACADRNRAQRDD
ncbi:MAG: SDR family NAD(P)-dependent oxidoreductase [Thiolinea sp.]